MLVLKACDAALEAEHFVRSVGLEHRGLKREPARWMPETYGELFDAYSGVWNLIRDRIDGLPEQPPWMP